MEPFSVVFCTDTLYVYIHVVLHPWMHSRNTSGWVSTSFSLLDTGQEQGTALAPCQAKGRPPGGCKRGRPHCEDLCGESPRVQREQWGPRDERSQGPAGLQWCGVCAVYRVNLCVGGRCVWGMVCVGGGVHTKSNLIILCNQSYVSLNMKWVLLLVINKSQLTKKTHIYLTLTHYWNQ